MHQVCN